MVFKDIPGVRRERARVGNAGGGGGRGAEGCDFALQCSSSTKRQPVARAATETGRGGKDEVVKRCAPSGKRYTIYTHTLRIIEVPEHRKRGKMLKRERFPFLPRGVAPCRCVFVSGITEGVKEYCQRLNSGEMYHLLAAILCGRSWDAIEDTYVRVAAYVAWFRLPNKNGHLFCSPASLPPSRSRARNTRLCARGWIRATGRNRPILCGELGKKIAITVLWNVWCLASTRSVLLGCSTRRGRLSSSVSFFKPAQFLWRKL